MSTVVFEINGQTVMVDDVDPHCTLLEWLRSTGLTGAKEGCAEGECGACAVAWRSRDQQGRPCYEAVNSCLVPLPDAHGRAIVSVEGLARGGAPLHPVQQALVDAGASQCGYCTPGFVMSLFAEYHRPGRALIDPEAIAGNLCRCTGYRPILEAARQLAPPPAADGWLREPPPLRELEYASGGRRFVRPRSLAAALDVLAEEPGAAAIAGGTDLMVDSNQRGQQRRTLVSLAGLPELQRFEVLPAEVVVGAALPLSRLASELEGFPEARALAELLPLFSSRLVRNRATLGGNLGTASPIGDAAPVLLALEAELSLVSQSGARRLPLREFFVGYRRTALGPGELIESVRLPRPLPRLSRFFKVSKRALDDISSVAAAFALDLAADGRIERLRVAYGGVAETPLRAEALERHAAGRVCDAETFDELARLAESLGTPLSDQRASAEYRRAMLAKLVERFGWELAACAEAAG